MDIIQTTQGFIDRRMSFLTPDVTIASLHEYMATGEISHIDQIARNIPYNTVRELMMLAVQEQMTTPASIAIFDAVMHRLVSGSPTQPDMFSTVFALASTEAEKSEVRQSVGSALIQTAKSRGLDDFALAVFWITGMSLTGPAAFKWNKKYFNKARALLEPDQHYKIPNDFAVNNVFEELILGLSDKDIGKLFACYRTAAVVDGRVRWSIGPLQALVAKDRLHVLVAFIDDVTVDIKHALAWPYILCATDSLDDRCVEYSKRFGLIDPLITLACLRGGKYHSIASAACMTGAEEDLDTKLNYLAKHDAERMVKKLDSVFDGPVFGLFPGVSQVVFCQKAADNYASGGKQIFDRFSYQALSSQLDKTNHRSSPGSLESMSLSIFDGALCSYGKDTDIDRWLVDILNANCQGQNFEKVQIHVSHYKPYLVEDYLWKKLTHRLKTQRDQAVKSLSHRTIDNVVEKAVPLLGGSKDARLGAVELLSGIKDPQATDVLVAALKEKQAAQVRRALIDGLESRGYELSSEDLIGDKSVADVLSELEKGKAKTLPKSAAAWLKPEELPPLMTSDGTVLSEKLVLQLIAVQSKYKTISAAPDNRVLLGVINKDTSGDFALALLTRWVNGSGDVKDKWALTLAGLLGDRRVLPALTDPIQAWGQKKRYKLAEYAVQAVALVPSNDALMLLDFLANQYRSKYRNIGKACKKALEYAAQVQKVSMEELGDIIVPTLEFGKDYQRDLPDTQIKAVLQPDFKVTFLNPETNAETKAVPKSLPDSAKSEITAVKKLITKTVKQQTTRLEQALVSQRTWTTVRWQELFEVNPFLQSFASRLVWAVTDDSGVQTKWFRRYPNGLLANAEGDLIELEESDNRIVLVHPLNIDDDTRKKWREHLLRMKIKPPFAQLDRAVEKLPESHTNRRSIVIADQKQIANGTIRSRASKQGWEQSGYNAEISAFCKVFPGAGFSAFLLIKGCYMGGSPTTLATLGEAMFIRGESGKNEQWYEGQPSAADAENVITFAEVPAVVYSETVADLQSFIAGL